MFLGIESLYNPKGFPTFELLSYILDSELSNVKKVLKDESINSTGFLACGDLKEIYSRKNFRQTEIVRESDKDAIAASGSGNAGRIFY